MSGLEVAMEESFGSWIADWYQGWLYLKFKPPGSNGWPDRVLIGPQEHIFFVEWKRPSIDLYPLQVYRKSQLEERGHHVEVWDSVAGAKRAFRTYLRTEGLPDSRD